MPARSSCLDPDGVTEISASLRQTDDIAERGRKIGGTTLRSIGGVGRHRRLKDNDAESAEAPEMLRELDDDNLELTGFLRQTDELCEKHYDVATASLVDL